MLCYNDNDINLIAKRIKPYLLNKLQECLNSTHKSNFEYYIKPIYMSLYSI
jgi:hypothetical protein